MYFLRILGITKPAAQRTSCKGELHWSGMIALETARLKIPGEPPHEGSRITRHEMNIRHSIGFVSQP